MLSDKRMHHARTSFGGTSSLKTKLSSLESHKGVFFESNILLPSVGKRSAGKHRGSALFSSRLNAEATAEDDRAARGFLQKPSQPFPTERRLRARRALITLIGSEIRTVAVYAYTVAEIIIY